ncbi:type VI secretion system membrane subunit TssM [Sodalis sp. RH24]|uniref:type VI secretion system membrane subunit TssM n=1 Tax=unclassified Sodalis (in: enterobacteria) TaxID=2636512 RepID=UPI0039B45B64
MLKMMGALYGGGIWRGVCAAAGVGLAVWFVGPRLDVGGVHPLASDAVRYQVIGAVTAFWLLSRSLSSMRQARFRRSVRRQLLTAERTPSAREETPLAAGFKLAARILKRHHGYGAGLKKEGLPVFGRAYLYRLPWYLMLGAGGSGKSRALQNAELDFLEPQAPDAGAADGPGRCDWYFTSLGVVISPCGSFLADGDSRWQQMLALLKRHRARRPLNGVVLTISAQDLLQPSREEHCRQAGLLRRRLLELGRQLKIVLPVYIMITKADCLAGFSQYFSRFDGPELAQPWGMDFPWRGGSEDGFSLPEAFAQAFDRLQRRLDDALADTLLAEPDARQRGKCLALPQAFAALRQPLLRYLEIIFASFPEGAAPAPRGVWFTSANQKTGPAAGALTARQDDLFDYRFTPADMATANVAAPTPQSYFLKTLFRDIILAEGDLAGTRRWAICRRRLGYLAGYGLLSALLLAAGSLGIASYHNNHQYLARVQARTQALEQLSAAILRAPDPGLAQIMPFFNGLGVWAETGVFDYRRPPLDHRMGLYRGRMLHGAGELVYRHALKRVLLPLVTQQLAAVLARAHGGETDFTYQALKAYQMLYEPQHYDGGFLRSWVLMTLPAMPGAAQLDSAGNEQLRRHLAQLITDAPLLSPNDKDQRLIETAQSAIRQHPLAQRVYQRLKPLLINDSRFKAISLIDLAGAEAEQVLIRNSGLPATDTLPGLFTPAGYWLGFHPRVAVALRRLQEEDRWVLNQTLAADEDELAANVRHCYMNEFITRWDNFLGDIGLMPAPDLNRRIDSARILSGEHSPLRCLVTRIGDILALSPPGDAQASSPDLGRQLGAGTRGLLNTLFPQRGNREGQEGPELKVRHHYRDLIALSRPGDENGAAIAFDAILTQLGCVYRYLVALHNSGDTAPAPGEILSRLRADALRLPQPMRRLILELAEGAGHDTRRQTQRQLRRLFDTQIGAYCRQVADGRYPLSPQGAIDLSPDDMARLFAPETGLADRFWRQHLADSVETGANRWHFFPGINAGDEAAGEALLHFFRAARAIGDAFFPPGATRPVFSFTLRPVKMDNGILSLSLDIDGQMLSYNHGPSIAYHLNWPGARGTGKARLSAGLADGTIATLEREGPWALNRLLDGGQSRRTGNDGAQHITFTLAGRNVTLEIIPDNVRNPFTLPHFSCAAQPEPL